MKTKAHLSILIVEDDPVIAHDISVVLKKEGYRVSGVSHNYDKALDMLVNREFDLAILDVNLGPGKSGIDVAEVIKSKYFKPFIFLTSYSDKDTLTAAQEQCPYGYLVKPFQEATLLSTISIALSNHKQLKKEIDFNQLGVDLTKQEQKVCEHLCKGKTYQEIADTEFVSINTIRFHTKNVYMKFDVSGRAELVGKLIA